MRFICSLAAVFFLAACGGGSESSSGSAAPPAPRVTVSPSNAEVDIGDTVQFSAAVSGASNTAVVWRVAGVEGGNDVLGRIDSTGLFTPPDTPPSPSVVTISAILEANSAVSGTSSLEIFPRYSVRTLNGKYVLFSASAPIFGDEGVTVGLLAADGTGAFEVTLDANYYDAFGFVDQQTAAGTYQINEFGEGVGQFSAFGEAAEFAFVMVDRTRAFWVPLDGEELAFGELRLQDPAAVVAGTPSGTFVFRFRGIEYFSSLGQTSVGRLQLDSQGNISTGHQDLFEGRTLHENISIFGGQLQVDNQSGFGDGYVDNEFGRTDLRIYVINDDEMVFISTDPFLPLMGAAKRQSPLAFNEARLEGNYVFQVAPQPRALGPLALTDWHPFTWLGGRLYLDGSGEIPLGGLTWGYLGLSPLPVEEMDFIGSYAVDTRGVGQLEPLGIRFQAVSADELWIGTPYVLGPRLIDSSASRQTPSASLQAPAGSYTGVVTFFDTASGVAHAATVLFEFSEDASVTLAVQASTFSNANGFGFTSENWTGMVTESANGSSYAQFENGFRLRLLDNGAGRIEIISADGAADVVGFAVRRF